MSVALVTGAAGLIGSQSVRFFYEKGFEVVGIDNHMRRYFFGEQGQVAWNLTQLTRELPRYRHIEADIRDEAAIEALFKHYGSQISVIIHCAAQPSHDWAAKEPKTDFSVNATGTLNLLEATRQHCPQAVFIFLSTNKVYGDLANQLPLVEHPTRFELDPAHPFAEKGIPETMSIDQSKHSLFGVSKAAADLMVQEYGRYFGLKTACFRGGCLTGPAHSGAQLHGFLSYLMRCVVHEHPYTVYGYQGKQVRDNIHSYDLVNALWHFYQAPKCGAVYNIGGGRKSHCSMLEAIAQCEQVAGKSLNWQYAAEHRIGDHQWWISDTSKFEHDYPNWQLRFDLPTILQALHAPSVEQELCDALE